MATKTEEIAGMIKDRLLQFAIRLVERGYIPDSLTRLAMRRLCGQRLRIHREDQRPPLEEFIAAASEGPIALVPDKANEQHYELPAEFFVRVLGKRRKYSCGYWPHDVETLDEAEEASLQMTCDRGEIEDGQNILDLGCGWGSLSLWIAERFANCRITALSNSDSQREFIEAEARRRGLDRKLTVLTADMNEFSPHDRFDRVVSVEMFEHMRNHQELLKRIAGWLDPGGKLFVHVFCHRKLAYAFQDDGAADWMTRNFFAGGIMPSSDLLPRYNKHMQVVNQWRWSGLHYSKTADAWIERLEENRDQIMPLLADSYGKIHAKTWFQRWRMFFMACSELFRYDNGLQWYVSHYLFEHTGGSIRHSIAERDSHSHSRQPARPINAEKELA